MQDLSKKIHEKLQAVEEGKLKLEELEELVDDAHDLYERLLILKYKAYEKFGTPSSKEEVIAPKDEVAQKTEEIEEIEQSTEEKTNESTEAKAKVEESTEVDEKVEEAPEAVEIDQPVFDFSISDEVESENKENDSEPFPEDEEIKTKRQNEEKESFPESSVTKGGSQDKFIDSHVEKHEPEDEDSLNQKLADEDELSLRKKLQSTPVTNLKTEISIAKKFEYITFMFDGSNELYEKAIEVLNNCSNGEEAREKLNEYSTQFNWDLENKSIIKFVELVERRYL